MGIIMKNGVAYGAGITPITIEGTLVANATSIAFTNDAILEGERYNVYAWDKPTVKPTNMVVSGHTLTLTYPAQSTDTRIKVVINENVNTLMFDDTNKADKSDLTSIFATGSTNTTGSAISAGTYFYLDNVLVRAKTSIATNATFTLNTNYEVVTAGALNELGLVHTTSVSGSGIILYLTKCGSVVWGALSGQADTNIPGNTVMFQIPSGWYPRNGEAEILDTVNTYRIILSQYGVSSPVSIANGTPLRGSVSWIVS